MQREERGYENRLHVSGPINAAVAGWDLGATDTRRTQGWWYYIRLYSRASTYAAVPGTWKRMRIGEIPHARSRGNSILAEVTTQLQFGSRPAFGSSIVVDRAQKVRDRAGRSMSRDFVGLDRNEAWNSWI
jgi:hypothetical protein